jgi:ligand-binding SRPBCC domain-containing protein
MGFYQFKQEQYFGCGPEKLWDFISSPANLGRITPPGMGFEIISGPLPEKMHAGMMIAYRVRPLPGYTTTWVTEITQVAENRYFVDEQRSGPYALWHHEHILEPSGSGTLMRDVISYKPPFGLLGDVANRLLIRPRLGQIFDYRRKVMEGLFNAS